MKKSNKMVMGVLLSAAFLGNVNADELEVYERYIVQFSDEFKGKGKFINEKLSRYASEKHIHLFDK